MSACNQANTAPRNRYSLLMIFLIWVSGLPAVYAEALPPLAAWSYDDITGSTVPDTVGSLDLTVTGTVATSSDYPSALGTGVSFDANGSTYMKPGVVPELNLTAGTVSVWVKSASWSGTQVPFSKYRAYFVQVKSGKLYLYNGSYTYNTNVTLTANEWHHIAITFQSGVTNAYKLYLDGVLIYTATINITNHSYSLNFGSYHYTSYALTGLLASPSVYSEVLDSGEILELYQTGAVSAGLDPNGDDDLDGMLNGYEQSNELDPQVDDSALDKDGDGLSNLQEFMLGSKANSRDTDYDGMSDDWEQANGLDLLVDDALLDIDSDGITNMEEYVANNGHLPIAAWSFDTITNSNIDDTIADLDMMLTGTQQTVADRPAGFTSGDAFLFDGATYLNGGNPTPLQVDKGTVSLWIKTNTSATSMYLISKQNSYELLLYYGNLRVIKSTNNAATDSSLSLDDNAWHHIVMTFEGGVTGGLNLYVDGNLRITDDLPIPTHNNPIEIGARTAAAFYSGLMYAPAIYHDALSADQVNQLYQYGRTFSAIDTSTDYDQDGMTDYYELQNGLNPLDAADAGFDPDADNLTNVEESSAGTDINDADTDGDGMTDGWEVAHALDPLADDAGLDADNDGRTNLEEFLQGTDPQVYDNVLPIADAGPDQSVFMGATVALDGTSSNDPDAYPQAMTYQWYFSLQPVNSSLSNGDITGSSAASASFTPDVQGLYELTLTVNDGEDSISDTVQIDVPNRLPVAAAGANATASAGTQITLDGSASNDLDNDPLSYQWTFILVPYGSAMSNASFSAPTGVTTNFTPDLNGDYVIELVVNDGIDDSPSDTVVITIEGAAPLASYTYNAKGQRTSKTVAGVTTFYVYGLQGELLSEIDETGATLVDYVYMDGKPVAEIVDSTGTATTHYIHTDHLGTPRAMTDQSAAVVWDIETTPFGKVVTQTGTAALNLRFPGQYADSESGLSYNYYRDYDPSVGRYVQSDPIGLAGGLNTYAYVDGNPVTYFDPYGLLYFGLGYSFSASASGVGVSTTGQVELGTDGEGGGAICWSVRVCATGSPLGAPTVSYGKTVTLSSGHLKSGESTTGGVWGQGGGLRCSVISDGDDLTGTGTLGAGAGLGGGGQFCQIKRSCLL